MKKLSTLLIAFVISVSSLYSQKKTIKGRVISDQFDTLTGTSIMVNDTLEVGRADMDGFFQIDIPVSAERITFRFLGVETTTIGLVDECNIEVVLMLSGTYDFMSLKRVDRKRKKKYQKLPEIHKRAYEKGLFETECPCYKREFELLYTSG